MQFRYDAALTGDYSHVAGCPPSNGTLRWKSTPAVGGFVTAPTVGNGIICAPSYDGYIYALNLTDGQPAWPQPLQTVYHNWSSPAIVDDTIYVGGGDGYLRALDAATGLLKWSRRPAPGGRTLDASPAVVGGVVYVWYSVSQVGQLIALDAQTGYVLKRYLTPFVGNGNSIAVANGVAYVGCTDRSVHAIDVATWQPRWAQSFRTDTTVMSSPSVAYGVVYVEDLNSVYAIDAATGEAKWPEPFMTGGPEGGIPAALTVANGMVFAASKDHNVYAINATTGQAAWPQPFMIQNNNMALQSSPVVFNGVVYVESGDGYVYAIGTQPQYKLSLVTLPSVQANTQFILTGHLTTDGTGVAGKSVTLQIAPCLGQPKWWRGIATAVTDVGGRYIFKRVARFKPLFLPPCFRTIYREGSPSCTVTSNVVRVRII